MDIVKKIFLSFYILHFCNGHPNRKGTSVIGDTTCDQSCTLHLEHEVAKLSKEISKLQGQLLNTNDRLDEEIATRQEADKRLEDKINECRIEATTRAKMSTSETSTVAMTTIDPCSTVACQNDGICSFDGSVAQCLCPQGYNGSLCETAIVQHFAGYIALPSRWCQGPRDYQGYTTLSNCSAICSNDTQCLYFEYMYTIGYCRTSSTCNGVANQLLPSRDTNAYVKEGDDTDICNYSCLDSAECNHGYGCMFGNCLSNGHCVCLSDFTGLYCDQYVSSYQRQAP